MSTFAKRYNLYSTRDAKIHPRFIAETREKRKNLFSLVITTLRYQNPITLMAINLPVLIIIMIHHSAVPLDSFRRVSVGGTINTRNDESDRRRFAFQ